MFYYDRKYVCRWSPIFANKIGCKSRSEVCAGKPAMARLYEYDNMKSCKSFMRSLHPCQNLVRSGSLETSATDHFETHSEDISRIARVYDTIIHERCTGPVALTVPRHLVMESPSAAFHLVKTLLYAPRLGAVGLHTLHDSGKLVGTHHTAASDGPTEQKARVVRPAAHGIVAGAVRCSKDDGYVWNLRAANGRHELRTTFDDGRVLGLGAHHEPGNVMQKDDRCVPVAAYLISEISYTATKESLAYCWLQRRMNCAPFDASSGLMTGT